MPDRSGNRDIVALRLAEDLVGPRAENEKLAARPSDVYLTGILWPQRTAMSGEDDDRLGTAGASSAEDSDGESDAIRTGSVQKPSVAGVSFSAKADGIARVRAVCSFGTYRAEKRDDSDVWVRQAHSVEIAALELPPGPTREIRLAEHGDGLPDVSLSVRCIRAADIVLVTLVLVNSIVPEQDRNEIEAASLFQTSLRIEPCEGTLLVPKPPRRTAPARSTTDGETGTVTDEESGALLYRNVAEFAVGHVCSAEWEEAETSAGSQPHARWVATTWLPSAIVEGVDPNGHPYFAELVKKQGSFDPLLAEALASADPETLQNGLGSFCDAYERWIKAQQQRLDDARDVAPELKYTWVSATRH
jgi:hypothetical protein